MHAARCPVPAASDDVVLIPELPSPGMLMTDGTHGATGITVIDGRLILLRPPVAVVAPGCLSACTPRRPAGYSRPQSAHYRRGPRARMSGVTDPGHRRRPWPRQARTAPAAPTLLGFSREMPGFHPRTVRQKYYGEFRGLVPGLFGFHSPLGPLLCRHDGTERREEGGGSLADASEVGSI